jgi:hypothetical protein
LDEIINYVSDNVHRIHINELAAHVKTALYDQLQVDMTQEQIRHHFLAHQCEQKLVLNHEAGSNGRVDNDDAAGCSI